MHTIQHPAYGPASKSKLSLMGIRFLEGEGGAPGAGANPAPDPAGAGTAGDGAGTAEQNAPWTKENFDPERAWKRIENMQADHLAYKTKQDQRLAEAVEKAKKETLAEFGRLLGGGEKPETDPAKLNQSITDLTSKMSEKDRTLASNARTIAVLSNPAIRNANTQLLLANKAFTDSIASVEPTDEAAITAAINKALQANAALQATPSRSGSGEHQGATVQSLEAQLAAAQQKGDKTESIRLKMAIAAARRRAKA